MLMSAQRQMEIFDVMTFFLFLVSLGFPLEFKLWFLGLNNML